MQTTVKSAALRAAARRLEGAVPGLLCAQNRNSASMMTISTPEAGRKKGRDFPAWISPESFARVRAGKSLKKLIRTASPY